MGREGESEFPSSDGLKEKGSFALAMVLKYKSCCEGLAGGLSRSF